MVSYEDKVIRNAMIIIVIGVVGIFICFTSAFIVADNEEKAGIDKCERECLSQNMSYFVYENIATEDCWCKDSEGRSVQVW